MAADMTPDEVRDFLSAGTRTGKLGSLMRDGSPHVIPIWFVLDGDELVFTTHADTVKGRHIRGDGRVSVCVDDEAPPYAFVHIRGCAAGRDDAPDMIDWTTRIGERYMGAQRAREFGERNAAPGELLVRLTPERVIAKTGVAD
jgi:PPOX class probable F420-dependent enzyme